MHKLIALFSLLLITAVSCEVIETTTKDDEDDVNQPIFEPDSEISETDDIEEGDELDKMLFETRSHLSDQFAAVEQEIPEVFQKNVVQQENFVDEYAGFRVQLLSTRNVALADSTKDNFRAWADTHIEGYAPEAYVTFRQPYYKVRVGDFRDKQKANHFSRMLKDEFPEAWVVHDRIEPEYLPADTTEIIKVDF